MAKSKTPALPDIAAALAELMAEKAKAKEAADKKAAADAKAKAVEDAIASSPVAIPDELLEELRAKMLGKYTGASGMMNRKYHSRYIAQGGNNGDHFAIAVRGQFVHENKDGDEDFDLAGFIQWAQTQGLWKAKYERLNPGQIRMNVGNNARAAIRNGEKVTLAGRVFTRADIKPVK